MKKIIRGIGEGSLTEKQKKPIQRRQQKAAARWAASGQPERSDATTAEKFVGHLYTTERRMNGWMVGRIHGWMEG